MSLQIELGGNPKITAKKLNQKKPEGGNTLLGGRYCFIGTGDGLFTPFGFVFRL